MHHLLQRDLTNFDAQRDRPQTRARLDQLLSSLSNVYRWLWEELLQRTQLPVEIREAAIPREKLSGETADLTAAGYTFYLKNQIYDAYLSWEKDFRPGSSYRIDLRSFWKTMSAILGENLITKKRIDGKPAHLVLLPPRQELAELFFKHLGCEGLDTEYLDIEEIAEASEDSQLRNALAAVKASPRGTRR